MFSGVGRKLTAELLMIHRKNTNEITSQRGAIQSMQAQINTLTLRLEDAINRLEKVEKNA